MLPPHIEALDPQHDRADFSCGEPELDRYLQRQATQDVRRRVAQVFIATGATPASIAGFYSLSASSFMRDDLPENLAKRLPRYPVPAAILGRLAVDQRYQGQKLGTFLLFDAFDRVLQASAAMAVFALIVDAKNDPAKAFYESYGFTAFPSTPYRLFIPLKVLAQAAG